MEQSHEIDYARINRIVSNANRPTLKTFMDTLALTGLIETDHQLVALPPYHEYKQCNGLRLYNLSYQMFACKKETEKQIIEELKKKSNRVFPFNISEVILVGHINELTPTDIESYFPVSWPHRLGRFDKIISYGYLSANQVFKARWKEIGRPDYICITKTKIKPTDLIDDKEKTLW